MSLQKLKQRALTNPEVRVEYEKLDSEFDLIDKLLSMRTKAGLTQEQIDQVMIVVMRLMQGK